ncbi:MAG: ABC-F family ATP-binding cassette domain-containing protein [Candidatus Pacebacteria bacterium]|nr:ABC-F family ATP-binding cassette domain-containing protein [Candidatus Paceibacterota bacterium]
MLKLRNVSKSYGLKEVLNNVTFSLEKGQKAALVAPNGTGKSTLLKIIAGIEKIDFGGMEIHKSIRLGYFPQELKLDAKGKVMDFIFRTAGIEEPERQKIEYKAKIMLSGFGFKEGIEDRKVEELSSGQKAKIALIAILMKGADLLLLDEPTNNLDLPSLIWLEDYLKSSEISGIIVSHDRRFLDNVTQKVFSIDRETRRFKVINGKYSHFLENEERDEKRRMELYQAQVREIERINVIVEEKKQDAEDGSKWERSDNDKMLQGYNRNKSGRSLRTAKVIGNRIKRMEILDKPVVKNLFNIPTYEIKNEGNTEIEAKHLVVGRGKVFKTEPIDLHIQFGKKICIIGGNGEGKSTLIKTLLGELKAVSGEINIGGSVKLVNMSQEHELLPPDKSPVQFLSQMAGIGESNAYNLLTKFDFPEEQAKNKISTMSPGERARLILIYFAAKKANVLVLDEPTNHMDAEAVSALKEFLKTYTGSLILISHDRYFIEQVKIDYFYRIENGKFEKIPDFAEYLKENDSKAKKLIRVISRV